VEGLFTAIPGSLGRNRAAGAGGLLGAAGRNDDGPGANGLPAEDGGLRAHEERSDGHFRGGRGVTDDPTGPDRCGCLKAYDFALWLRWSWVIDRDAA